MSKSEIISDKPSQVRQSVQLLLDMILNHELFLELTPDISLMIIQGALDSIETCDCGECFDCHTSIFDGYPFIAKEYERYLDDSTVWIIDIPCSCYDEDDEDEDIESSFEDVDDFVHIPKINPLSCDATCFVENKVDRCLPNHDSPINPESFQLSFDCFLEHIEQHELFNIPTNCRMMIVQHVLDLSARCDCGDCSECCTSVFDNHRRVAEEYEHFLSKELNSNDYDYYSDSDNDSLQKYMGIMSDAEMMRDVHILTY